ADRQPLRVISGTDRSCRLLRKVEWRSEAYVLERLVWIIARRCRIGRIGRDRRSRTDQEIVALDGCYSLFANRHDLGQGAQCVDRSQLFGPSAPCDDERQHLDLSVYRHELKLGEEARLEKSVESVEHVSCQKRRNRRDDGPGSVERACGRVN